MDFPPAPTAVVGWPPSQWAEDGSWARSAQANAGSGYRLSSCCSQTAVWGARRRAERIWHHTAWLSQRTRREKQDNSHRDTAYLVIMPLIACKYIFFNSRQLRCAFLCVCVYLTSENKKNNPMQTHDSTICSVSSLF